MTASLGIRVIRSSPADWRSMKKECRHARHNALQLGLVLHSLQQETALHALQLELALHSLQQETALHALQPGLALHSLQ